jgi:transcriptional regulator with XRE-family HTH domain
MIPATTYAAIVGAVIATYRERLGEMTQAECAKRMKLSPSTWSRIEHGASALTIVQLAQFCDVIGFGRDGHRPRALKPQDVLVASETAAGAMREQGIRVCIGPIERAVYVTIADSEARTFAAAAYDTEEKR